MEVSVTTRFVDRLLLAKYPDNPDAADTPIGAIVTADPPRALELVRAFVAVPVGMSVADLERAVRDFALAANAVEMPVPVAPPAADVSPAGDAATPDDAVPVEEQTAEPVADQSAEAEPPADSAPSDGGPVDLTK